MSAKPKEKPPVKRGRLSLADLTDEMLALDDLAAMDFGEWTPTHDQLADELGTKIAKKTDNAWDYRETLWDDVERAKELAARILAKANRLAERAEWLDGYIMRELDRGGRGVLKGDLWEVRKQRNSSPTTVVEVLPGALPPEFVRVIPETREPDRDAIKRAILGGAEIAGCRLEYGFHLRAK